MGIDTGSFESPPTSICKTLPAHFAAELGGQFERNFQLLKGVRSDVAQEIRRMPDFVMQNPNTKEVYFVEVKFRASGSFKFTDLPKNYPYENAYIILVSKKHIKCITVAELQGGKDISPTSHNYLGNRKEFDLDKNVIIDFCRFALLFFENV